MRQTILLADDSPTIQRLVAQTFAEGNYHVVAVSNGEAAIRRLEETRPDVVLADIYMPGRTGYEVCAYVRAHQQFGTTPVILLVGAFDVYDEETAAKAGASASITKPFEPSALIELVNSVIASAGPRPAIVEKPPEKAPDAPTAAEIALEKALELPAKPAAKSQATAAVTKSAAATETLAPAPADSDILGLSALFTVEQPAQKGAEIGEAEVERIAERVMQKLSAQAVESVAWDVVPEIAEKVIRDTLKKNE